MWANHVGVGRMNLPSGAILSSGMHTHLSFCFATLWVSPLATTTGPQDIISSRQHSSAEKEGFLSRAFTFQVGEQTVTWLRSHMSPHAWGQCCILDWCLDQLQLSQGSGTQNGHPLCMWLQMGKVPGLRRVLWERRARGGGLVCDQSYMVVGSPSTVLIPTFSPSDPSFSEPSVQWVRVFTCFIGWRRLMYMECLAHISGYHFSDYY